MSENIVLEPGAKVRQSGQSYKVVDTAVVTGELIPVTPQKNHHRALVCLYPPCVEKQKQVNHGRPIILRSGNHAIETNGFMPVCGNCGNMMHWQDAPRREGEQ